jgi:hypothetical protein
MVGPKYIIIRPHYFPLRQVDDPIKNEKKKCYVGWYQLALGVFNLIMFLIRS